MTVRMEGDEQNWKTIQEMGIVKILEKRATNMSEQRNQMVIMEFKILIFDCNMSLFAS